MVFEEFRTVTLSETNMRIILEEAFDEFENEWYTYVSGKDGAFKKEENPEIFKDGKIGN